MVNVRMRQDEEVDRCRVERELLVIQFLGRLAALEESTVDQKSMLARFKQRA